LETESLQNINEYQSKLKSFKSQNTLLNEQEKLEKEIEALFKDKDNLNFEYQKLQQDHQQLLEQKSLLQGLVEKKIG